MQIWTGVPVGLDLWESSGLDDALGASISEKMSDASNGFVNKLVVAAKPGTKGAGLAPFSG